MQESKIAVAFYYGLRGNDQVIDQLVQSDPPLAWVPAIANIQEKNIDQLMSLANISPSDWRNFLLETYDFDVLNPSEIGLDHAAVDKSQMEYAMELAAEQKENWEMQEDIDDLWPFNPDLPKNLSPAQVYEVIAETQGRGTPVISFQSDEDVVMKALSEDNLITLKPKGQSIFIGLSDPINGISWTPDNITNEIIFRPSQEGLTILGDDDIFHDLVDDSYLVDVTYKPGEPLRLSSSSEDVSV